VVFLDAFDVEVLFLEGADSLNRCFGGGEVGGVRLPQSSGCDLTNSVLEPRSVRQAIFGELELPQIIGSHLLLLKDWIEDFKVGRSERVVDGVGVGIMCPGFLECLNRPQFLDLAAFEFDITEWVGIFPTPDLRHPLFGIKAGNLKR
jgi:hypothetical protein